VYSVGKRLRGKKTACSPRRKEKKNNGLISKILDWCRSFVFILFFAENRRELRMETLNTADNLTNRGEHYEVRI
jgi:hypothetical protein